MEFNDKGKRKVYNVDLDGTLTNGELFWKQEPTINPAMLEKVIELYKSGNIIIIWTARQWQYAPETVGWLIKNCVPYHGIQMGKGGADCYIDDKNVLIKDMARVSPKVLNIPINSVEDIGAVNAFDGLITIRVNGDFEIVPGCNLVIGSIVYKVVAKDDGYCLIKPETPS